MRLLLGWGLSFRIQPFCLNLVRIKRIPDEEDMVAVAIKIHRDVQNTRKKKETGI